MQQRAPVATSASPQAMAISKELRSIIALTSLVARAPLFYLPRRGSRYGTRINVGAAWRETRRSNGIAQANTKPAAWRSDRSSISALLSCIERSWRNNILSRGLKLAAIKRWRGKRGTAASRNQTITSTADCCSMTHHIAGASCIKRLLLRKKINARHLAHVA